MEKSKLQKLEKKVESLPEEKQEKYFEHFSKSATFIGNGVYSIAGLYSTDTRELLIMYICQQEFNMNFTN